MDSLFDEQSEETSRRFHGDYRTPTIWADRAHELLTEVLGRDWKRDFVVWDAACGTRHLTRHYEFGELYLSTLFQAELDASAQHNRGAVAFQYDFLNDDVELEPGLLFDDDRKMPESLYAALCANRPIVFLMNPPYGTATNDNETSKDLIAATQMNKVMVQAGLKKSAQQLYSQFFHRVVLLKRSFGLTDVVIAFFTNDRFMCGGETWEAFLADMQADFRYEKGVFFNAGEFTDVSTTWGISLTVWLSGASANREFPLSVEEATAQGIRRRGVRVARSVAQADFLSTWAKEPLRGNREYQPDDTYVRLSNAFTPNTSRSGARGRLLEGAIGYAHNNANDVEHSPREVGLYSTAFGSGNGFSVLPVNLERACVNFMVRKAVPHTWVNGHDNFVRPSAEVQASAGWADLLADALVFAIANPSGSNQSALRGVSYRGHSLDVVNQWFFMGRKEMAELARRAQFQPMLLDLKAHPGERHVYQCLQQPLSAEAGALLAVLKRLVRDTFPFRGKAYYDDPAKGYQAWDAGFWQLYLLAQQWQLPVVEAHKAALEALRVKAERRVVEWGLL